MSSGFIARYSLSTRPIYFWLVLSLVGLVAFALFNGQVSISFFDVTQMIQALFRQQSLSEELLLKQSVFFQLRLPRVLLALFSGVSMACAGVVFQASLRNALVSPEILGVSAGCSLGALFALVLGFSASLVWMAPFAFGGGMAAVLVVLFASNRLKGEGTLNMILIGLVLTSLLNALVLILKYAFDPYQKLPSVLFWMLGSFNQAGWSGVIWVGLASLFAFVGMMLLRYRLNLISIGDVESLAMGFSAKKIRYWMLLVASGIVAVVVAGCGQIGWIALMVPHFARALVGPNHLRMAPVAALIGAVLMLGADLLSYGFTTTELPLSAVTALVGAPAFAWLLFRLRGAGWE